MFSKNSLWSPPILAFMSPLSFDVYRTSMQSIGSLFSNQFRVLQYFQELISVIASYLRSTTWTRGSLPNLTLQPIGMSYENSFPWSTVWLSLRNLETFNSNFRLKSSTQKPQFSRELWIAVACSINQCSKNSGQSGSTLKTQRFKSKSRRNICSKQRQIKYHSRIYSRLENMNTCRNFHGNSISLQHQVNATYTHFLLPNVTIV